MLIINGKLELNENNEYIVKSDDCKEQNISKLLYHNWYNEIPAIYSLSSGTKTYISEEVVLQKKKSIGNLYEYYADNVNLEDRLFRACGKTIEFTVEVAL
jgi:hypothetical protein